MTTKTEAYIRGMEAINNFYNMLYAAMLESMPGARIIANGAYVWRGYQIDHFEDLAQGQYFCEIYPGDPDIFLRQNGTINSFSCRELVFQEDYNDRHYKPVDQREILHCIKTGDQYYPFRVSFDLYRSRFFLLNNAEQYGMLKNFVAYAAKQALIWNRSYSRKLVTNPKFLNGINIKGQTATRGSFEKVNIEFLDVWKMQDGLFTEPYFIT